MELRLQKFLSRAGYSSRREAEEIIKAGRVSVNSRIIKEMGYVVDSNDVVMVDGEKIVLDENKVYYMINKPRGYVSTLKDDKGRRDLSVFTSLIYERVFPIGRLDYDTSGLLFLTNDGDFSNLLLNPKYEIEKEYIVKIKGLLRKSESDKITRGGLDFGDFVSLPNKIYNVKYNEEKTSTSLNIILKEGKNREIRRLFSYVGHDVSSIKRIRFGNIFLDVKEGMMRPLKPFEVKMLKLLASMPKENKSSKKKTIKPSTK